MALDAYVMPLWRFKAGDFTSPIEATLGIKPTIISPAALEPEPRPPWPLRLLAALGIVKFTPPPPEPTPEECRANAIEEVAALKAQLTALTAMTIEWLDEGEVHYNKQFHDPTVLQAFAAWHDHRDMLPKFLAAPNLAYEKHPVWELPKPATRRFPTLAEHSLHTGYLLPVAFEGIYRVEPFKAFGIWDSFHDVASTQTALRELADLLQFLATVPEVREEENGSIPVKDARWYAEELQRICSLSLQHSLPVIFHG